VAYSASADAALRQTNGLSNGLSTSAPDAC
jgi:hypothetical protein